MRTHELKTDPEVFVASMRGDKTFEIRLNDRDFQEGDLLVLRETEYTGHQMREGKPLSYTGRALSRFVTYVLDGYGLKAGWVILGVRNA